jgi:CubicO group peptidase (beta-lactamase class C family)
VFPAVSLVGLAQAPGGYTDIKEWPDSPEGRKAREAFDVINSNDPARIRTFVDDSFAPELRNIAPMERHIQYLSEIYEGSRGYEFAGVRRYTEEREDGGIVVIVRNKLTEAWEAIVVELEPEPPHQITNLYTSPARPPSYLEPPPPISEAEIPETLKAFVEKMVAADVFSGTVLLAKDGKVLFQGAWGLASKRFNVPNRIDTKFNLGSMNKMFTGVTITRLVQEGKLSLDDRLSQYLSTDWLPTAITDKIKIKHLLTHTSGLGSYFNDTYMKSSKTLFRELDDYKPLVQSETLAFEPGTDWSYSNTGMFLLGVVIEKVTEKSYFDVIRERIYEPAGMNNSDCYEMDRPVPNLAIGYSKESSDEGLPWTNNYYKHVIKGGPAGGGFSTVEDLLRFDQALRSHKLLDPEHTEMVWSPKPELNSPEYGFGFGISGGPGNRIVGHSGGFSGISSNLDMFLDSGYTAAVMSNYDRGAIPVQNKIRELLARASRP